MIAARGVFFCSERLEEERKLQELFMEILMCIVEKTVPRYSYETQMRVVI